MLRHSQRIAALTALLTLLLLILGASPARAEKSWSIRHVTIATQLQPDGSLLVREQRTLHFEGEFHHLWQNIRVPARSELTDLQLLDDTGRPFQPADTQQPGTYNLADDDDGQRLDWYIDARDTDRTFTVRYRISVAPRLEGGQAVLHWQAVGDGWDVASDDIDVTLDVPGQAVNVTADGPVDITPAGDATHIKLHRAHLDAHTALGIRVELPADGIGALPLHDPVTTAVQWGGLLAALAAGAWFFFAYVRRPRTGPAPERDPVAPALVAELTDGPADAAARATLLDLALRGSLAIAPEPDADWRFSRVPGAELAPHEEKLLDAFFPGGVDSIALRDWAAHQETYRNPFAKQIASWYKGLALPEAWQSPHRLWLYAVAVGLGILVFVTGLGTLLPGILGLILAVALLVLGFMQPLLTPAGKAQLLAWEQARAALAHGPIPTEEIAYAVALGLPLQDVADPTEGIQAVLSWYEQFNVTASPFFLVLTEVTNFAQAESNSDGGSVADGGDGGGGGGAE